MFATLMYHIVDRRIHAPIAVSEEAFEAQLAHLRREGYTILTLDDVLAIVSGSSAAPSDGVFVTFDDGYSDNLTAALPRLQEHGIEATMFVPTAHVGHSNGWNPKADYEVRHLDWDGLERWIGGGGRIGGHMHEHVSVKRLDPDALRAALTLNKRLLEERLGQEIRSFAYPYGDISDEARLEVSRLYDTAFSVYDGIWDFRVDRYVINRLAVDHGYGLRDFAHAIEELFASFEAHSRRGGVHVFEQFPSGTAPLPRRAVTRLRRAARGRRGPLRLVEVGVEWPPETFLERKFERLSKAGVDIQVVAFRARNGKAPSSWSLVRIPRWDGNRIRAALGLVGEVALLLLTRPRGLGAAWKTRRSWSGVRVARGSPVAARGATVADSG